MEWLLVPFGGRAIYVVGTALIVIAVMIIWAFSQGRTVEFWPPKIGSQPSRDTQADEHSATTTGMKDMMTAPSSAASLDDVARMFEVSEAAQFYQEIGLNYDQRNSVNLLATHMEVIIQIEQAREARHALRVLDLGGGTGQNVATHFFHDHHICWTYVDYCPAMINQLRLHLEGRPLYERLSVHLEDINRIHLRLPVRSYDVVLLNLVLSSMPKLPDFSRIATLLAPGGRLIVADINPTYTSARPYYKATAADGALVALRTQPVQPLEVVTHAKEAKLQLMEMTEIGSDTINYSFTVTFVNPGAGFTETRP